MLKSNKEKTQSQSLKEENHQQFFLSYKHYSRSCFRLCQNEQSEQKKLVSHEVFCEWYDETNPQICFELWSFECFICNTLPSLENVLHFFFQTLL